MGTKTQLKKIKRMILDNKAETIAVAAAFTATLSIVTYHKNSKKLKQYKGMEMFGVANSDWRDVKRGYKGVSFEIDGATYIFGRKDWFDPEEYT